MNWDDFKYFSTVARCGSARGAARDLRVHPSTVTRRIEYFEARLGVKLFARTGRGLVLTPVGAAAVRKVAHVEKDLGRIEQSLKEDDLALVGKVRVAVPEFLLLGGVLGDFKEFADAYPGVVVDWLAAPADVALAGGAAEIGLLATSEPPLDMVGRQVGRVAVTAYCSEHGSMDELRRNEIGWVEWRALEGLAAACATIKESGACAALPVIGHCDTIPQLLALLTAGTGVGALPCVLGDATPGLARLPGATLETCGLWLLTAPEARYTRRVKALREHLAGALGRCEQQIAGTPN